MLTFDQFCEQVAKVLPNVKFEYDFLDYEDDYEQGSSYARHSDGELWFEIEASKHGWFADMRIVTATGEYDAVRSRGESLQECLALLQARVLDARSCYDNALEVLKC